MKKVPLERSVRRAKLSSELTTVKKFANLVVKVVLDQEEVAGLLCAHSNAHTRTQKEVEAEYDSKEW